VCEESPNDGAKWWLTDGEWAVVAYLSDGENGEKEEASAGVLVFIVGRERGSDPGPACRHRTADGLSVQWERDVVLLPCPGKTRARRGWFEDDPGHCSTRSGPIH
jgi:hypothetical protein